MFSRVFAGLLAVALLQAPLVLADEAIRSGTSDGRKHAEINLNPDPDCLLESDRIACGRASR